MQTALSSKVNYVGNVRGPSTLCWKTSDREHVLVADQLADPLMDPIVLEMIGQVGRGGGALKPHGTYNPLYKNFPKAKITFELEMPNEATFAADYLRGITFLKRLERNARPAVDGRNLFLDSSAHSNVRFGAPLFRVKRDENDEEEMPDDYISPNAVDASYFPTSANWPITPDHVEAFEATRGEYIFCPIHVVDLNDQYVEPVDLARRLPGSLVKVYFTLRYWNFKDKQYNSFSANIVQVQILKAAQVTGGTIGRRLITRASARVSIAAPTVAKRGASPQAASVTKKAKIDSTVVEEACKLVVDADDAVIAQQTGSADRPGGSDEGIIVHVPVGGTMPDDAVATAAIGVLDVAVNSAADGEPLAGSSKAVKTRRGAARV